MCTSDAHCGRLKGVQVVRTNVRHITAHHITSRDILDQRLQGRVPAGAVASHRGAAAAIYAERSDSGKGNVGSSIRGHGHDSIGSVLTPVKGDTPDAYVCDHRQHMCWIVTIFLPVSVACHEREKAPRRQKCVCLYIYIYVCVCTYV